MSLDFQSSPKLNLPNYSIYLIMLMKILSFICNMRRQGPFFSMLARCWVVGQSSPFGVRFGLSDNRARRTSFAPLVETQASARSPQQRGG